MSSSDYFLQLLALLQVDSLRLPLLQGMATSAVAGAEGLIRASRSALIQYVNDQEPEIQGKVLASLLQGLSTVLSDNLQDDRYAIPTVEFLAFVLEGYIHLIPSGSEALYAPFKESGNLN